MTLEKLGFHSLLADKRRSTSDKKPSFWAVDDISEINNSRNTRDHYKLVRLVRVNSEEPSLALYYLANNEMILPNYLLHDDNESDNEGDNRIGYGRVFNFDRKLAKKMYAEYNAGHTEIPFMLEPYLFGEAFERDFEIEQALQKDLNRIQLFISDHRIHSDEDNTSGSFVTDKDIIHIHTFNVGQGDTLVIRFPNNRVWIIDAFFCRKNTYDSFISWLSRTVPGFVCDKLILSHLHYDHIRDAILLMNFVEPKDVIYREIQKPPNTISVNVLRHAAEKFNLVALKQTETLYLGKAKVQLIPTNELSTMERSNDVNTKGIIVTIETPKSQVLLPGDVHGDQLCELVRKKFKTNYHKTRYYKVTHHCSITGSNLCFLHRLNPTHAVTSCGKNNRYKHPNELTKQYVDCFTRHNNGTHWVTANTNRKSITWNIR